MRGAFSLSTNGVKMKILSCTEIILLKIRIFTGISDAIGFFRILIWRRGRDSNPRGDLRPPSDFESAPL